MFQCKKTLMMLWRNLSFIYLDPPVSQILYTYLFIFILFGIAKFCSSDCKILDFEMKLFKPKDPLKVSWTIMYLKASENEDQPLPTRENYSYRCFLTRKTRLPKKIPLISPGLSLNCSKTRSSSWKWHFIFFFN